MQITNLVEGMRIRFVVLAGCLILFSVAGRSQPLTAEADQKVEGILKKLTLDEKIGLLSGMDIYSMRGVSRLGLPRLEASDGPLGVHKDNEPTTMMTAGIALAATWNQALAEQIGTELGRDARARGVHFLLGPGVNIYRSPLNGRNFEYLGEDPFLASQIAVGYIRGVQRQSVCATVKHFAGNNSEFARTMSDSIIDERTLREIYLPVFEAAVKDGKVCAVMTAYNLTNGTYMSENIWLNKDILKKEWNFPGLIISDWWSTHGTLAAANGGLDLEMPDANVFSREKLVPLINSGKITIETINDKVRRYLRTAVRFGWYEQPQLDQQIPRYNQAGRVRALQEAREGIVLLKNTGNVLPLDENKIKRVAVIGPNAFPAIWTGGGSAFGVPYKAVSFLDGISDYLGTRANTVYARGIKKIAELAASTELTIGSERNKRGVKVEIFSNRDLSGSPVEMRSEPGINFRPIGAAAFNLSGVKTDLQSYSMRWSGFYQGKSSGKYDMFVQNGAGDAAYRLIVDGKTVVDNWQRRLAMLEHIEVLLNDAPHKIVLEAHSSNLSTLASIKLGIVSQSDWVDQSAVKLAAESEVAVITVGFDPATETEGADRTFRLPPGQDQLISEIAAVNKNTVVVVTSGGAVEMNRWINDVPAIIEAWYPGQEGGTALAEILFGMTNPSGKLPATFENKWSDNPTFQNYYPSGDSNRIVYNEGVFVGYRGFEKNNIKPQFPFGYGMSYTTFEYSNLRIEQAGEKSPKEINYNISFDVSNTGNRSGATVAQIYVSDDEASIPRPAKELKNFAKVYLRPHEKRRINLPLNFRSFAFFDTREKVWKAEAGIFDILIGESSADIKLIGLVNVKETVRN